MIGFHGQRTIDGWLDPIGLLPSGTPFVSVDDVHMCKDAKNRNPGLITIFRKEWTQGGPGQHFSNDYEVQKQRCRDYFNSFIDGSWMEQSLWSGVSMVKEWNEYVATSQTEVERQLILLHLQAVNQVWNTEYRGTEKTGGLDIPLVCISAAIGNEIDSRFARVVWENDNVISYHGYTHFPNGQRDPFDWTYHSGRWSAMDARFNLEGIFPKWIMTEGGPYVSVYDGWKSPNVLNGDLSRYIEECVKYQIDNISAWNQTHGNRHLGGVLFTFGNTGAWKMYELNTGEMTQIAQFVRDYSPELPPPPPPPPGDDWKQESWDVSISQQSISLNPNASLQGAIFQDGFVPVQSEFWFTPKDGIQRAFMGAEHLETGQRRVYYAIVPNWGVVDWFTDPKV